MPLIRFRWWQYSAKKWKIRHWSFGNSWKSSQTRKTKHMKWKKGWRMQSTWETKMTRAFSTCAHTTDRMSFLWPYVHHRCSPRSSHRMVSFIRVKTAAPHSISAFMKQQYWKSSATLITQPTNWPGMTRKGKISFTTIPKKTSIWLLDISLGYCPQPM